MANNLKQVNLFDDSDYLKLHRAYRHMYRAYCNAVDYISYLEPYARNPEKQQIKIDSRTTALLYIAPFLDSMQTVLEDLGFLDSNEEVLINPDDYAMPIYFIDYINQIKHENEANH